MAQPHTVMDDESDHMSDASSDAQSDAQSWDVDGTHCHGCDTWSDIINICHICHGSYCNRCSFMCPGGCSREFCSDCARTSLVHYLPDDGRLLHVAEVLGGDPFAHNEHSRTDDMFYGNLNPFCSVACVNAFTMEFPEEIHEAKVELARVHTGLAAHMKLKKWAMFFKFLLRLGFFNTSKRMTAAEAAYKPGSKGHKRARDEFEEVAFPQFHAVRAWVNDLLSNLN